VNTDKNPRLRIVQGASEVIRALMKDQGVHKAELARRVGKSRAYVTQSLSGDRNMTLSTLASFADALNADAVVRLEPRGERTGRLTPKRPAAAAAAPTPRSGKRGKQS
jgi:transcriptional regulator with XRE-family HTH domain